MNEPPRFPFWFTVAAMVGNIVIKKDGFHVQHFEVHVPTKKQLNVGKLSSFTFNLHDVIGKLSERNISFFSNGR